MKIEEFINKNDSVAIVLKPQEYDQIREKLIEFYTEKQIADIDEHCDTHSCSRCYFLLCNPFEANLTTPIMYENAVTFIDRIPFSQIEF